MYQLLAGLYLPRATAGTTPVARVRHRRCTSRSAMLTSLRFVVNAPAFRVMASSQANAAAAAHHKNDMTLTAKTLLQHAVGDAFRIHCRRRCGWSVWTADRSAVVGPPLYFTTLLLDRRC